MNIKIRNLVGLVSYITSLGGRELNYIEIDHIISHIEAMQEPTSDIKPCVDLRPLFDAICKDKKFEAIKHHTQLTGMPLKDSKDEIERLMNSFSLSHPNLLKE